MKQRFITNILIAVLFLLMVEVVYGCQSIPTALKTTPVATNNIIKTTFTITVPTSSPTRTVSPSATPWPTRTPTLLPIQVTATQEAFENFFIEENGGCEYPCWWGFNPGFTKWSEISDFTELYPTDFFIHNPDSPDADWGTVVFKYKGQKTHQFYYLENEVVKTITIYPTLRELSITKILENYGKPAQVWLGVESHKVEGDHKGVFYVLLFYPKEGMIVWYISPGDLDTTRWYRSCLIEYTSGLILWSKDTTRTFEEVILENPYGTAIYSLPSINKAILLEQATGMTVEEFYANFSKEQYQNCLLTERILWDPKTIP